MTVASLLQNISNKSGKKSKFNILILTDDFLENWVKASDIDTLMVPRFAGTGWLRRRCRLDFTIGERL
jgi:hypothetical protein